ncbi:MAG: hypothetical protein OEN50_19005 [Deltaproteobacteria bacterium]|nr:hypothetical protein [Deltaproteobacteria bacterium]
MKAKGFISALVVCLAFTTFGCDIIDRLTATKIKEILDNPREYENKEVTVYGTVTDAASMLIVKYFEVQDDSGKIKVVTVRTLPAKGEKLKVTGRTSVLEVGSERWVVLREKSDNSKKAE